MDELNCAMTTTTTENSNAELVQWERFLPRMVLRVLLVEVDHSTCQIIAALLCKCSYTIFFFFFFFLILEIFLYDFAIYVVYPVALYYLISCRLLAKI